MKVFRTLINAVITALLMISFFGAGTALGADKSKWFGILALMIVLLCAVNFVFDEIEKIKKDLRN